jgi:hypothetical protein
MCIFRYTSMSEPKQYEWMPAWMDAHDAWLVKRSLPLFVLYRLLGFMKAAPALQWQIIVLSMWKPIKPISIMPNAEPVPIEPIKPIPQESWRLDIETASCSGFRRRQVELKRIGFGPTLGHMKVIPAPHRFMLRFCAYSHTGSTMIHNKRPHLKWNTPRVR